MGYIDTKSMAIVGGISPKSQVLSKNSYLVEIDKKRIIKLNKTPVPVKLGHIH